ncbi:MAG: PorT family protein [Flavobacterium sp.]|uniref:porin family protein n=1 Tax=Flavobacterium sp. TaxID=239 RepID=UPI001208EE4A|nr:porin family protein [Flavobacterium sp.]RZJ66834.1 MAG: PorT family protein [Flavobacterium sp.]
MKKIFLLAFAIVSLSVSAQVTVRPGVRGGFVTSDVTDINGTNRNDFYVGTFLAIKLAKWYKLQPEIAYSRQGMKARYTSFDPAVSSMDVNWDLDYVGLTINNKFYVFRGLNLQIGPYLDFLVNSKNINPNSDADTGLNLGIGYDFKNGLGVELRFRGGLIDIFEDEFDEDYYDEYTHLNGAIQIGVTYTFDLKKK